MDGSDYSKIDNGYLTQSTGWNSGDFNYDNAINGSDYTLIDNAFNSQGSPIGVSQTLASIAISPGDIALALSTVSQPVTKQFTVIAVDQFGNFMPTPADLVWSCSGGGTISVTGIYTAPTSASTGAIITATASGISSAAATINLSATGDIGVTVTSVSNDPPVDPTLGFPDPSAPVLITVARTNADTSSDFTFDYYIDPNTSYNEGVPSLDYDPGYQVTTNTYEATIPAGSMSTQLSFTPLDDQFNTQGMGVYIEFLGRHGVITGPTGHPSVYIKQASGAVTQLSNPSSTFLRAALQQAVKANDPITELDITAHGAHDRIELGNGDLLTTSGDGTQIIDQSAFDLTPLLNSALSPSAIVKLQGCHTGANDDYLGLHYDKSLAAYFSRDVSGRTVEGGKRFLVHVGLFPNTVGGVLRVFKNGNFIGED